MQSNIFFHIPKTAGNSIVTALRETFGTESVYYSRNPRVLTREYLEHLENFKFLAGHYTYAHIKPLRRELYTITFMRDPVERVISNYYFYRNSNTDELDYNVMMAKNKSLKTCLEQYSNEKFSVFCNY